MIRPYLGVLYYKKQGGVGMFYWQLLSFAQNYRNGAKKGEFYYTYNEVLRKDPDARFVAENQVSRTNLVLLDPKMIKALLSRHDIYQ